MAGSQKLLIAAGLALVMLGMGYGLWYALVDEHPTLEGMGLSMATGFAHAADGNLAGGRAALGKYAEIRFEYLREVHAHAHLSALSTMLIVLGLFFQRVAFAERKRIAVALALIIGSVCFPLGVLVEIFGAGFLAHALAMGGSLVLIGGLAATAAGLLRAP